MLVMIKDIIRTFFRSAPDGFVISILITILSTFVEEKSLKNYTKKLDSKEYRLKMYFITYLYMIIYRLVLCRPSTYKPLKNVFGGWGIEVFQYTGINYGSLIGNILLFLIYTIILLVAFKEKFKSQKEILGFCTLYSFLLSLFVELAQLILKKGTFQISDLVYNALGGLIGAGIYILIQKKRRK